MFLVPVRNKAPVPLAHLYSSLNSPAIPNVLFFEILNISLATIGYHFRVLQLVVSFTLVPYLIRPVQPTNLILTVSQMFVKTVSFAVTATARLSVSASLSV